MGRFLILLSIWVTQEPVAAACSCSWGDGTLAPAKGQDGVPVDTLIWVGSGNFPFISFDLDERTGEISANYGDSIVLRDATGHEVLGEESRIYTRGMGRRARSFVQIFRPRRPLASNQIYTASTDGAVLTTFTTGKASGVTPSVPTMLKLKQEGHPDLGIGSCGAYVGASFTFAPSGQLIVSETVGETQLDTRALSGEASAMGTTALHYGRGACSQNWPDAAPWHASDIRFGAFDITGRFSGWSQPQTLRLSLFAWALSLPLSVVFVAIVLIVGIASLLGRARQARR